MSEFVQKRKEVADRQEILKTLKAIYQAEMSDEMEFDGEMWAAKKRYLHGKASNNDRKHCKKL